MIPQRILQLILEILGQERFEGKSGEQDKSPVFQAGYRILVCKNKNEDNRQG